MLELSGTAFECHRCVGVPTVVHLKLGGTNEGNRAVIAAVVQSDQYRSTRAGIEPRIMSITCILVAQAANK